ncbi:hypothetical protein C2857_000451 [Epichloe festucae Fl1]|uniref:Uncharacterized protein n=1 Tax=Epichloe festucae (strain Fl1) TaxID=877507 RepID=A0A7U3SMT5_EPIFF|nr:hypothetical protein C2857_000451 [Epichloe festucae Fl1]
MSPFMPPKVSVPLSVSAQSIQKISKKPTKQETPAAELHRASSIGSWFKQILPSNRPERGGTLRQPDLQVQDDLKHQSKNKPRRPASQTRRNRRGYTVGSDQITEWNLPRNTSDGGSFRNHIQLDPAMDGDRKWSWAPGDDVQRRGREHSSKGPRQALHGTNESRLNVLDAGGSGSLSTPTPNLQSIQAKQEARRLRRNLKESGDYLGVQGFNPETGKLDVITPSNSERSSLSQETQQKLHVLKNALKDARHYYKSTKEKSEEEAKKILLRNEKEKGRRLNKGKDKIQEINKTVTWKRHARQWSSAQEPNLSPIAQSIVETTPASRAYLSAIFRCNPTDNDLTGRQSKACDVSVAKRGSNSSLIDLNHLDKEPELNYATQQTERALTKSPDSTATVVRTPHRQSFADLAEMGPSAWELFMNGISFDTSGDTEELQENKSVNVGEQEYSNKAHGKGESLLAEGNMISNHEQAQARAGSFLDKDSEKLDDPGVTKAQVALLPNKKSHASEKETCRVDVQPRRSSRNTLPLRHPSLRSRVDTMDHGNTKLLKRRFPTNGTEKQGARIKERPSPIAACRKKIVPNWGHWMGGRRGFSPNSKTSSPRMLSKLVKTNSRQQKEHSVLILGPGPNPSRDGAIEPISRPARHAASSRPMLTLGVHTKYMSPGQEPKQRTRADIRNPAATNTGPEAQLARGSSQMETAKDITMQSNFEPTAKCASTHTTTTTGCDQRRSKKSFRADPSQETNSSRAQPVDWQSGAAIYSLPPIATSESSLGSSVMKPLQKPSSRVKLAKDRDEIGTTLKLNPGPVDWFMKKNMKPFLDMHRAAVRKTDIPGAVEQGIKAMKAVDWSLRQPDNVLADQPNPDSKDKDVDVDVRTEDAEKPVDAGGGVPHEDTCTHVDVSVEDDLTALVRAPGRFPCPNAGGGGMTCGCRSSSGDCRIAGWNVDGVAQPDGSSSSMLDTVGDFLGVVWCYMLPLWQMYWERVGPLFTFKSEYWSRQDRDEGTLTDCLTVVLAVPVSLLLIAGCIVALRLGLLCVENFKAVREWVDDVYWYVMQ